MALRGARYNHPRSGWFDTFCFQDWLDSLVVPYFCRQGDVVKVMLGDNLSSHVSDKVLDQCQIYNIRFIL